jgi:hypothetical protein
MIPVALNTNRIPDDDAGKFFKEVMKSSRWPQGIWIVSPEGKVLAFNYFQSAKNESPERGRLRWVRETLGAVEDGLKAFGSVTQREGTPHDSMPDRGVGLLEDVGVRLAIYAITIHNGKRDGDPVVDSTILSGDDWKSFSPQRSEVGQQWTIPETAAKKLVPALSPITDAIYSPLANDAKLAKLTCKIESVEANRVLIQLKGKWETEHFREGDRQLPIRAAAAADGYMEYDPAKKQVTSLLLVLRGAYRSVPPWDTPRSTAGVIEWKLAPTK